MAALTGYVGPQSLAAGASGGAVRQDITGAMVMANGRARTSEQTTRGLVFAAFVPPGTGVAPGTAIGTTAAFGLGNPSGSGKNLVLLRIMVSYISGTLGAGTLALLRHATTSGSITAITGTAITPSNMLLASATASVATAVFTATVPATGLMIRAIASMGAGLASTALFPSSLVDDVGGEVVIAPGAAVSVQGIAAAGTSPLLSIGAVWAEESTT